MKRKLKSFREVELEARKDPVYRQAYLDVVNEEIGAELRSMREAQELTQTEVGARMGYANRSRVAQIEASEGLSLALGTVVRYAQALGFRTKLVFENAQGSRALDLEHLPDGVPRTIVYSSFAHELFASGPTLMRSGGSAFVTGAIGGLPSTVAAVIELASKELEMPAVSLSSQEHPWQPVDGPVAQSVKAVSKPKAVAA